MIRHFFARNIPALSATAFTALAFSTLTLASFNVSAQEELDAAQITERVQAKVARYAEAVTCKNAAQPDPVLRPYHIGALQPYQLDTTDPAEFVGFWLGDMGCKAETGSVTFNLINVKTDPQGAFFVDASASEPAINVEGINSRFVDRVVGASLDTLTIDGLDFEEGDNINSPSKSYRYTLKRQPSGSWKVTSKRELDIANK